MNNTDEIIELISDAEFTFQDGVLPQRIVLLGSESENSYLKMGEDTYIYAKEIVSLLQQHMTQYEIAEEIKKIFPNRNIDVPAFISKLKNAGLIVGNEKIFDDEMGLLGVNIFCKRFANKNNEKSNFILKFIYRLFSLAYLWCPVIMVLCFVFTELQNIEAAFCNKDLNNFAMDAFVTLLLTFFCFLFHELGHAIAALNNGIKIKEFSFGLYLGVIPTFYFRYYNLKVANPKVKLKVIIAGIYVNTVIAVTCFAMSGLLSEFGLLSLCLYRFSKLNLLMIVGNLLPSKLSDGYYMVSLLSNKYDIRLSFWRRVFGEKNKKKKTSLPLLLYFCLMIASLIYTLVSFAVKIYNYINVGNYIYGYGLFTTLCIMLILVICNVTLKLCGEKLMITNLIKKQLKIKTHTKHCIGNFIIAMLFVVVVAAGSIIFENAENHSLTKYWEANGKADIIAIYSSDSISEMNEIYETADSVRYANITEAICSDNNGKSEIPVMMAETDINELKDSFNLETDELQTGGVLVNSDVIERIGCEVGDTVIVNSNEYVISGITDAFNFVSSQNAIVIVDKTAVADSELLISFIDFKHDSNKINDAVEVLRNNNVSFMNQFEGSQSITDEFSDLGSILFILVIAVFVICFVLVLTSFSLTLKNESSYWVNMRVLGISKSKMIQTILWENTIFSFAGSVLGFVLALFIARLICRLTDTIFEYCTIGLPIIFGVITLGVIVVMLPIFIVVLRNTRNEIMVPFTTQKTYKKSKHFITLIINFVLALLSLVALFTADMWLDVIVSSETVCLEIKLILSLIALILFVIALIDCVPFVAKRVHSKSLLLITASFKNQSTRIKGITIALVVCVIMLGSLIDFSNSYKTWVSDLANQQLTFDARMTANNDGIGLEQIALLDENINVVPKTQYYLDVGKLSNLPVYIIAEKFESSGLNQIYNCSVEFNGLKENEIALTKRLMNDLGLQKGDTIRISFSGQTADVVIVESFDTQDYSSYIAVVSNTLFDVKKYSKICVDFDLNTVSLQEIKKQFDDSTVIESKDNLIDQWKDMIVSGVEQLVWICFIIAVALLLMLNNFVKTSIFDRKQELSLLRTMGLSKKEMLHLLLTEIAVFHIPSLAFTALMTPVISKTFVDLTAVMSNYEVEFNSVGVTYLLIWLTITFVLFVNPLRFINKIKSQSPIESLKYI